MGKMTVLFFGVCERGPFVVSNALLGCRWFVPKIFTIKLAVKWRSCQETL